MELYDQLVKLVSELNEDVTKFYDKGNKAAGTRVRKTCQDIKNLGITSYPDEVIMEKLIKYSGHLNLTVRALLCEQAQTSSL